MPYLAHCSDMSNSGLQLTREGGQHYSQSRIMYLCQVRREALQHHCELRESLRFRALSGVDRVRVAPFTRQYERNVLFRRKGEGVLSGRC